MPVKSAKRGRDRGMDEAVMILRVLRVNEQSERVGEGKVMY
jgi:hypothetical protein